jgi:glycosyltransferase involved in cell wall biosynthesis
MDVVHVVHAYPPAIGGTEFLFQRISEELVSRYGDRVTVLTTDGYNPGCFVDPDAPTIPIRAGEVVNGVTVRRFPVNNRLAPHIEKAQSHAFHHNWPLSDVLRTLYNGPISWPMFSAIRDARGDVLVASAFPLLHMYYAALGKRFNQIPLLYSGALHPHDRWGYDRAIILRAIAGCDIYLAYTTYERDYLLARGVSADKIRIASPGVDPKCFEDADRGALRKKLGWEDRPVIAFVGQQAPHKGIETLYRAMRLVWRQVPEAHLIVAGGRTAYSVQLDKILAQFSAQERDRIHLIPNFAEGEKADIFAACDIFVSPSGHESFGITFIEAWAAGKPVIGCRSGAIPTVIDEWQDGLLVPYQDIPQLAAAMLELLHDERQREQMARRGRDKVLAEYTWEKAVARFRHAYEEAMERHAGGS